MTRIPTIGTCMHSITRISTSGACMLLTTTKLYHVLVLIVEQKFNKNQWYAQHNFPTYKNVHRFILSMTLFKRINLLNYISLSEYHLLIPTRSVLPFLSLFCFALIRLYIIWITIIMFLMPNRPYLKLNCIR